jgi:dienelactone hydrolase
MAIWRRLIVAIAIQSALVGAAWCADAGVAQHRPYLVRDTVELSKFTVPSTFSPDGRYFVTVTERGVLPQGLTEATVWLFETAAVRKSVSGDLPVHPVALARVSAAVNDDGIISQLAWEQSGTSLLFLGRSGRENRQLFRARLQDHSATALTPAIQDVVSYAASPSRIVYFAAPNTAPEHAWWANDPSAVDVVNGTGQSLMEYLFPNYPKPVPTPFEVWQVRGAIAKPIIEASTRRPMKVLGSSEVSYMSLSHDGSRLVAIANADRIPPLWARYEIPKDPDVRPFQPDVQDSSAPSSAGRAADDYGRAVQYQFFDLTNGTRHALLEAPVADFHRGGPDALQAAWSADDRFVAVSGTYLPMDSKGDSSPFTGVCGAAVIEVRAGSVACLLDHPAGKPTAVAALHWDLAGRLIVEGSGFATAEYEQASAMWQLTGRHPEQPRPALELALHQSLNEPPVLAVNDSTGHSHFIFDPNPQLSAIDLGTVAFYRWKDPRGRDILGALAKPSGFVSGHRYPLVIQTHNLRTRRFFAAGTSETATAGRALTARGVLVLQVDEPEPTLDWEESQRNGVDVYLAAIDKLTADGFIDPKRVGITGYSRAGTYVAKAITQVPERFAAAVLSNTDAGTLSTYEAYVDYLMPTYADEAANFMAGAKPYGSGLQKWLERAPGFHSENVRAPVLFSVGGPQHLLGLWGFYAALRDQGKPVELQYFRSGAHTFRKPLQILAHEELLVDWFDFWLNGHEDPSPEKAEQYARWRKLRAP